MTSFRSQRPARALAPALLIALLALAALATGAAADSWAPTAAMTTPRVNFPMALLPNGQVLAAGGFTGANVLDSTDTSERYDPASGRWLATPSFGTPRQRQGMSLLPDGRALMTGGYLTSSRLGFAILDSAFAFDPATNAWSTVASMPHPHGFQQQLTLKDGRVLVIGGYRSSTDRSGDRADDQIELYDPATGAWRSGHPIPYFMANGTATLLDDGRVLVAGGSSSYTNRNIAITYDPTTDRWANAGSFTDARAYQVAARLPNGKVLIAGGLGDGDRALRSASLYDPATNRWADAAPMASPRDFATATLLPNGKVLVAGGFDGSDYVTSAELYDPATNGWSPAAAMRANRGFHAATLLADGRVLVAGGYSGVSGSVAPTVGAEVYTPDGWPFGGRGGGDGSGGGKPGISRLALSATRFRAAASGPSVIAARRRRPPVGTTISYRDGAAATATFTVLRPTAGRGVDGRCVRATRANRRRRRCTRWVAVGRFKHADAAGANSVRFSGRVGGAALLPGRFRLTVSARAGRGRASAARAAGFRIVA